MRSKRGSHWRTAAKFHASDCWDGSNRGRGAAGRLAAELEVEVERVEVCPERALGVGRNDMLVVVRAVEMRWMMGWSGG